MLRKYNLIAVGGLKNSGKDEVSKMIQYCLSTPKLLRQYWIYKIICLPKYKYKIVSFADHLKECLSDILRIPKIKFNERDFKENYGVYFPNLSVIKIDPSECISDNKFNKMLENKDFSFFKNNYVTIRQLLQAFGTNITRDIFGDKLWVLSTLNDLNYHNIIISDVRFNVEFNEIKKRNGYIIYVNRPNVKPGNHASEKEIFELYKNNKFDYVLDNSSTLKDLFNKIKNLC